MPRYDETDFPPDIELLVAASNWALAPSSQGWARVTAAMGAPMPADMEPVVRALEKVRELCDGQTPHPSSMSRPVASAMLTLSETLAQVAHRRRANAIRRHREQQPARPTKQQPPPPEDMGQDAPSQWWQR